MTTMQLAKLTDPELDTVLADQAAKVKTLKLEKQDKSLVETAVAELLAIKKEVAAREAAAKAAEPPAFDRSVLESMLTKRFFYCPSFEIYGGVSGLYDYGPAGTALQNNILSTWRQHFVLEENMLEIDCTNLTPHDVLKTSGHVDRFADYMVKDEANGDIFRADHLVKSVFGKRLSDDAELRAGKPISQTLNRHGKKIFGTLTKPLTPEVRQQYQHILDSLDNYDGAGLWGLIQEHDIRSLDSGNAVTEPKLFNLMFETSIGPTGALKGYMRPETAQSHFLNFRRLLDFNNMQMPFASAQVGRSFRNEISPRAGLLRVREFTMAEIEHFVDPTKKDHPRFAEVADLEITLWPAKHQLGSVPAAKMKLGQAVQEGVINNETLGYFVGRIYLFLTKLGVNPDRLRFRQHMDNEMAHYACDCWDAEIESSYGWVECVGCADRSAYDLTVHAKRTGERLFVQEALPEPVFRRRWVLNVNKKKLGPAFKKDAAHVTAYLDAMMVEKDGESLWDQAKIQQLKRDMESAGGKLDIVAPTNKQTYTLTADMVTVEEIEEKISVREFTPNVIEPSFGIGRIFYSLLEHVYWTRPGEGNESRGVLSFPPAVAPTKALVVPISNNAEFTPIVNTMAMQLRKEGLAVRSDLSSVSLGRRYARNDELGTPFAVTVDFQTVKDQTVTVRERDSTEQVRCSISDAIVLLKDLVDGRKSWSDAKKDYPVFVQQEL